MNQRQVIVKYSIYGLAFVLALALAWNGWQQYRNVVIVVEWSTASELDTVGFNLFRGLAPEGETEKINPTLLPPSEDPLVGGSYSFTDNRVVVGQKYYYWLEDVNTSGTSSRHGPIEVEAQRSNGALIQLLTAGLLAGMASLWFIRETSTQKKKNHLESATMEQEANGQG